MMELFEVRRRRAEGQTLQQIATASGVSRQAIHIRLLNAAEWIETGELHKLCGWAYTVCGGCVHHTTERRAA